jgi:hypothetical protein
MRTVATEVNPAIFTRGTSSAISSTQAAISWLRGPQNPTYPAESLAGLWSDTVTWDHVITAEFDATNAPVGTPGAAPAATLMIAAHNKGSNTTVLSLQTICGVHANGKEGAGVNFITYCDAGLTNPVLKGNEIDVQPGAGSTGVTGFGLGIVAFSMEIGGDYIHLATNSGGFFSSGIRIDKLNASSGAGIYAAGPMGCLFNTNTGTFGQDAGIFSNTHAARFSGTASAHAKIYNSSGNILRLVGGSAGVSIRNNADSATTLAIGDGALGNYANDAAASGGGVAVGQMYRNGSVLMQRIT